MIERLMWYWKADRLGPEILSTHWLLFFKRSAEWLCRRKFKHFGEGAEFRPYAFAAFPSNIAIGKGVIIRPTTMLFATTSPGGGIVIEDEVGIGAGVHIYVSNHGFNDLTKPIRLQDFSPNEPVRICRGAWIGANAVILAGVTIGNNAVVGAGAVVSRDVRPFTVVRGNPARVVRDLKFEIESLNGTPGEGGHRSLVTDEPSGQADSEKVRQ